MPSGISEADMDWTGIAFAGVFVVGALAAYYLGASELAYLFGGAVVGQQFPGVRRAK